MDATARTYLSLLELGRHAALEPLLSEALSHLARATGAQKAYLELYGDEGDEAPAWSTGLQVDPIAIQGIRLQLSRGIVAEAIASGRSVLTDSAVADPRFRGRPSVRQHDLRQVLCAPIGDDPVRGVLFLTGRGNDAPFAENHRVLAENVGRFLWPLVDRILVRRALEGAEDPTARWRAVLDCPDLVGRSPALARLLEQLRDAASADVPLMLLGPSGAGKTHVARVVHRNSHRRDGPVVVVDCPATPDTLFEAELFGAAPGAFTGQQGRRAGLIRTAEGGTLFLDEIGDLAPANQVKLLNFLESRTYRPLGMDQVQHADVRIIAATHRDVEHGSSIRQDLYWRLAGLTVRVPGLDERAEDLLPLARSLLGRAAREARCAEPQLGPAAARALRALRWPGHVRQLYNVIRQGVVRASVRGARVIEPAHLFPEAPADPGPRYPTFQEHTRRFQADVLRTTLAETEWNVSEAARRLDLTRAHVYNLIRAHGLARDPDPDGSFASPG